jgi:hypothetical protein
VIRYASTPILGVLENYQECWENFDWTRALYCRPITTFQALIVQSQSQFDQQQHDNVVYICDMMSNSVILGRLSSLYNPRGYRQPSDKMISTNRQSVENTCIKILENAVSMPPMLVLAREYKNETAMLRCLTDGRRLIPISSPKNDVVVRRQHNCMKFDHYYP